MSDYRAAQAQRREAVDELLTSDPERSDRAIGKLCSVNHSTVQRRRRLLEVAGTIPVSARHQALAGAPVGNERASRSGQLTKRRVEPLKQRHLAELRERFPAEPEIELGILASRMARAELIEAYLDARGLHSRHELRSEVVQLDRLEVAIERTLVRCAERGRSGNGGAGGLSDILAGLQTGGTGSA